MNFIGGFHRSTGIPTLDRMTRPRPRPIQSPGDQSLMPPPVEMPKPQAPVQSPVTQPGQFAYGAQSPETSLPGIMPMHTAAPPVAMPAPAAAPLPNVPAASMLQTGPYQLGGQTAPGGVPLSSLASRLRMGMGRAF